MQVWNMNAYNGVVGVFHLQGSSWDRTKRQFQMHNSNPAPLETKVRAACASLAHVCVSEQHWSRGAVMLSVGRVTAGTP